MGNSGCNFIIHTNAAKFSLINFFQRSKMFERNVFLSKKQDVCSCLMKCMQEEVNLRDDGPKRSRSSSEFIFCSDDVFLFELVFIVQQFGLPGRIEIDFFSLTFFSHKI